MISRWIAARRAPSAHAQRGAPNDLAPVSDGPPVDPIAPRAVVRRVAVASTLALVLVLATVITLWLIARDPPRDLLAEQRRALQRPPRGFGDPAKCDEIAKQYATELALASRCDADDECFVELRGEQWYSLDGCERYRSSKIDFTRGDSLAKSWLAAGCVDEYELCSRVPAVMCRAGRCVERPPSPAPDTWVRYDISSTFSLYLPPDLKPISIQGTDSLVRAWKSEHVELHLDFGNWSDPLLHRSDSNLRILDEQITTIAGKQAKLVSYALFIPNTPSFSSAVHFPSVPPSPVYRYYLDGPTAKLTLYAHCDARAPCEALLQAYRSIVFW